MSVTIVATPGAANANSYETLAEAIAYYGGRLPLSGWDDADDQNVLLVMATRVLDSMAQPVKTFFPGNPPYYRVRRQWTGRPATSTQRLAWPRIGMYDRNGYPIPADAIPQDLKDAQSELAGQLGAGDRTLDNDVIVQGIKSVSAGSVSVSFKDTIIAQVIPDYVYNLMPQSWLTDELYLPANVAEFDIVS